MLASSVAEQHSTIVPFDQGSDASAEYRHIPAALDAR
jgi:hypothetical protein